MLTLLHKKLSVPRKASRWFVFPSTIIIFLITMFSLTSCTHHSCEENDSSTRYISLLLNQYINDNYFGLLERVRHEKGITTIYFASRARVTLPSQTEVQQCWVTTNNSEYPLPAFQTMSDSSFYTLSNSSNAPCYLNMVIDYDASTKLWDVHVYNFNPDQLPFSWIYKQVLGNIEVGLYNLTV